MTGSVPMLAATLRRALLTRAPQLREAAVPDDVFVGSVAACDAADRAYRDAIEAALPRPAAQTLLTHMASFRERAQVIRMSARAEMAELRTVGAHAATLDPFDVVAPRIDGVNHVEIVRLGDIGDRARRAVDAERVVANERIAPLLDAAALEQLVAAKRARNTAFLGALHAALVPLAPLDRLSSIVEGLGQVVEGWY